MSTITSSSLLQREPAAPGIGAGSLRSVLLMGGILSSLVYVAANVAAGLSWEGYSFTSQTISELSAIGAPSRSVWLAFGIPYNVLLIAFGIGVWGCAGRSRGLRVTAAMLIAIGVIGAFWPPMHLRGNVATLTDTMHVVFASIVSIFILLAIAFGAKASGKPFRIYSLATIGGLVLFGALTFAYAPRIAANQPTPWLGVVERVNLGGYLLWVAVLSVVLLRGSVATARAQGRPGGKASSSMAISP